MAKILHKNIAVNYSDKGSGSVVVLLHGFLENMSMWNVYVDLLSEKYRVVTIDLLGHGETECLGYVHKMEDNAEVVYAVLHSLKIKKAIVAGHSMGGYVALAIAEKYPNLIKGLILINSTSKADSEERKANRDRAILAVKQNYTAFVRMSIANLFSEDNRERLASDIENVREEALKTSLQGIVATLEGMKIRPDREFILRENRFPTLLILGTKDPVLNYEDNSDQGKYESVTFETLPDGHMSTIENVNEMKVILGNFIKKLN